MNILFYTPVNFRCRDVESLAKKYSESGNNVLLYSQCPDGPLHESFRTLGLQTLATLSVHRWTWLKQLNQLLSLILVCWRHDIHVVYSHLEPTNFISVIAQHFIGSKVVIYRHHIDEAALYNFNKSFAYQLTYRRAKKIISVSERAKSFMIKNENIQAEKIVHINLGYDFSLYEMPGASEIALIREKYPKGLLLVTAGRLTKYKRPEIAVELVHKLNGMGVNCSLLVIGKGEMENELHLLSSRLSIQDKIFFVGYTNQILHYFAAADALIHPSVLESSCVVVKEAALVELPVFLTKGVGDFDEYMVNGQNGFMLDKENFVNEAIPHIKNFIQSKDQYLSAGKNLRKDITSIFNIEQTFPMYEGL